MLRDEQITKVAHEVRLYQDGINTQLPLWVLTQQELERFAKAIEAEIRNQDDVLIQQMLEALEYSSPNTNVTYAWQDDRWALKRSEAIIAARARLKVKA